MEMDFQFVGRNIELTDSLKNYARKRSEKLLKYLGNNEDRVVNIRVKMEVESERQIVDLQLNGIGEFFEGRAETPDMYSSIDRAVDKLARQLRKYHDRITDHRKKDLNGPNRRLASKVFSLDQDESEQEREIIQRQTLTAKPMSVEEAVLQMEKLDYEFFVFTNHVTEDINVVYRREDGNYGVIETGH